MPDIQDFGKKIGGARKDVWKSRGIMYSDISEMNEMERETHVKKDNIWLRPDWEQVIKDGTPQVVAYWQNHMRQAIPPRPPRNDEETLRVYIETVRSIRDLVMAVKEPHEIDTFYKQVFAPKFVQSRAYGSYVNLLPAVRGIVTNKVLRAAQDSQHKMQREAEKKMFGIPKDEQVYVSAKNSMAVFQYDDETVQFEKNERRPDETILKVGDRWGRHYYYLRGDNPFKDESLWEKGTFFIANSESREPLKINIATREEALETIEEYAREVQKRANEKGTEKESGPKRKGAFTPPQLRHVNRSGPEYRHGKHADSDMFLDDLKFRGGEFGNWLNHVDRQVNLDMAYDALRDLSRILQIRPEDISLNGTLAIAFGARGRGGAGAGAAHYEPDRQVINLTKMSGAGCLAHEWGHALDHAIGRDAEFTGLASESPRPLYLPQKFKDLISALKYKEAERTPEEIAKELQPQVEKAKKSLMGWVNSAKPSNFTKEQQELWDSAVNEIISNATTYTGLEYQSRPLYPRPEIEVMSQLCKTATNHVIPKETKIQFTLWARELGSLQKRMNNTEIITQRVKTDFYNGAIGFDNAFSKAGHGYWQSDCEMFARAFDCYVADKLRDAGCKSDYLSAHADSFAMKGSDGSMLYAFPRGEERRVINEKFDVLFDYLKERGLVHDFIEPEIIPEEPTKPPNKEEKSLMDEPVVDYSHSEQLSFDALLFNAEARAKAGQTQGNAPTREPER